MMPTSPISSTQVYIDGIGLLGPGLTSWKNARAQLLGKLDYVPEKTVIPAPIALPPAERRRCGAIIKLALAVGFEAIEAAQMKPAELASVFSSSGGDGHNCHEICQMLASNDTQISPTRFHNSVHNAAAGYWSIAAQAMSSSSVLCAHDASFGAGLLEAISQVAVENRACVLFACDTDYPEPLRATRPIPYAFGVGLVLAPEMSTQSLARLSMSLKPRSATSVIDMMRNPQLEQLRMGIPAARALPLLQILAAEKLNPVMQTVVLDYFEDVCLELEVTAV